jgi:hypothetical protein
LMHEAALFRIMMWVYMYTERATSYMCSMYVE